MDHSAEIARWFVEMPHADVLALAGVSDEAKGAALHRCFPAASTEEFVRGAAIAKEFLEADRQVASRIEMVNNPCACGEPGICILLGKDGRPTGERRCFKCDIAEADAEAHPCIRCGETLAGEDVRAGVNLCEACDPDEYGWVDPATGEP